MKSLLKWLLSLFFRSKEVGKQSQDAVKIVPPNYGPAEFEVLIARVGIATDVEKLRQAMSELLNQGYRKVFPLQPRRTYIAESDLTKRLLEIAYAYKNHEDEIVRHLAVVIEHNLEHALGISSDSIDVEYEDMFFRQRRYHLSVPRYNAEKRDLEFS